MPLTISLFVFSFALSAGNLPSDLANSVNFDFFLVFSRLHGLHLSSPTKFPNRDPEVASTVLRSARWIPRAMRAYNMMPNKIWGLAWERLCLNSLVPEARMDGLGSGCLDFASVAM
ncbi:hypothetical protein MVEN_00452800 [Mycena venus]|uniref:Secreted protein n=1 Tax=Mycena venus TaxID=2733690 RepID=A0A8H7DBA6_9AGAR|nr:hypothetical protein MVEN_00452800 [Mycena venus]